LFLLQTYAKRTLCSDGRRLCCPGAPQLEPDTRGERIGREAEAAECNTQRGISLSARSERAPREGVGSAHARVTSYVTEPGYKAPTGPSAVLASDQSVP